MDANHALQIVGTRFQARFLTTLLLSSCAAAATAQIVASPSCRCACTDSQAASIAGCNDGGRNWELRLENTCSIVDGRKSSADAAAASAERWADQLDFLCRNTGSAEDCNSSEAWRAATPVCMACCSHTSVADDFLERLSDLRDTLGLIQTLPQFRDFQDRLSVGDLSMSYAENIAAAQERVGVLERELTRIIEGTLDSAFGMAWYEAQIYSIEIEAQRWKGIVEGGVERLEPPEWVPGHRERLERLLLHAGDISSSASGQSFDQIVGIIDDARRVLSQFDSRDWDSGESAFEDRIADLERRVDGLDVDSSNGIVDASLRELDALGDPPAEQCLQEDQTETQTATGVLTEISFRNTCNRTIHLIVEEYRAITQWQWSCRTLPVGRFFVSGREQLVISDVYYFGDYDGYQKNVCESLGYTCGEVFFGGASCRK